MVELGPVEPVKGPMEEPVEDPVIILERNLGGRGAFSEVRLDMWSRGFCQVSGCGDGFLGFSGLVKNRLLKGSVDSRLLVL